ncbi:hypothetical protein AKI39_24275 [Bordetella sp. H567]|uniref:hypothetical protein n=1 Tax=Bordetella sp. H567 TaxID=1697043 RepID=UPI00081C7724|nr:hypothetical protein [Bordetella sp. H567]AOB33199.1 hypothetical protein AKI39_24275 [Bordetella sp. H567]
MLSRIKNLPKVDGMTLVHSYSWFSAAQGALQRFKRLELFTRKRGNHSGGLVHAFSFPKVRANTDPYYFGYYNVDNDAHSLRPVSDDAHSLSEEEFRNEIARQWAGEIERYIKMGGEKEDFIDFISAARTGFPDERDQEANDKVKWFRESFIDKASRDDILHVMELHSTIRSRVEQSERDYLAKGDDQAYRECAGRISRLDRGKQQLQLVLKRKSAGLVS